MDECGFNKVFARGFMNSHLMRDDLFVYPHECNQVFLVKDQLQSHWKIVGDIEVRKTRVYESHPIGMTGLGEGGLPPDAVEPEYATEGLVEVGMPLGATENGDNVNG